MFLPIQKNTQSIFIFLFLIVFLFSSLCYGQPEINYDESKVGAFTLPSLLVTDRGEVIKTQKQWEDVQRPALLRKFAENVYGRMPGKAAGMHYRIDYVDQNALEGKATRKEVTIFFTANDNGPVMNLLMFIPNKTAHRVPVFVGLNFQGNHSVQPDVGIRVTENWKRVNSGKLDSSRGRQAERWPVKELIENGYAVATAFYGDLEPDSPEGWHTGIRSSLQKELGIQPSEWGAIGAWAWGMSRIMDYLLTDEQISSHQVVLTGHSRLGKAALWAAANDRRFAIVISNESGEGGAALARRNFGETIERINTSFPHWFIDKYKTYNKAIDKLPVDQHMLLALIAPRPLYVASAVEDKWADPKGEFLSAKYASAVYALYGKKGLDSEAQPGIEMPVGETVRYHVRNGKHDMNLYDWQQYIEFANKHFNYHVRTK